MLKIEYHFKASEKHFKNIEKTIRVTKLFGIEIKRVVVNHPLRSSEINELNLVKN